MLSYLGFKMMRFTSGIKAMTSLEISAFIKEYFHFSRMNIEIDGKFENLPGIKITLGVSL